MTGENEHQGMPNEGRHWQFGWCEFVEQSRQLLVHGQPVRIEAKPADVLVPLLEKPGEVHAKDELLGECWPDSRAGASDNSLTQAIRKLRVAFGGGRDELLLTVPVTETIVVEPQVPVFHLEAGDSIPRRRCGRRSDRLLPPKPYGSSSTSRRTRSASSSSPLTACAGAPCSVK